MALVGTKKIKKYKDKITGRVWVFPDNVDTDAISPSQYMDDSKVLLEHTCETIDKNFAKNVIDGDIIVAGINFGCGSSRETAPIILQEKGITAIIADSFARIFYRSAIARALPVLEIEGVSKAFQTGNEIEINIPNAEVKNLTTEKEFKGTAIDPILLELLKIGGLEEQLKRELKEEAKKKKKN